MVKVTYDRRSHAVFLRGHADSAEKGRDLVCAAVSILAYTLGAFVLGMKEAKAAECVCVDLLSGDTAISCTPCKDEEDDVTTGFDAICRGFALLAENYPRSVTYETV